jgi:pyridoxal phosphate enzyme (YggS family)
MTVPFGEPRHSELVGALAAVRSRIADACAATGRDPRTVTLVAVTKTYPAADVVSLLALGALDIGESRDQEAAAKVAEVQRLRAELPEPVRAPRWHFVGRIQSRKCRSIAGYAHAVHSLDRSELVGRLAEAVRQQEREPLQVFLQVSLDGDPSRGGILPADVARLADQVLASPELALLGVMAVAPIDADPDAAFAKLREVSEQLRRTHPQASAISAGMSGDFEAAVRHGATHLRIGSALLGRRPPVFG